MRKVFSVVDFRFALAFLFLLALPPSLAQQSEGLRGAGLDVLSIDGPKPKDVLAFAVGERAAWILTKDILARVDAITGMSSVVRVPPVKTWSSDFSNATIAAGSFWVTGEINKIQGVHRIDLKTGKLISSIPIQHPFQAVGGNDAVWIFAGVKHGRLVRIDPQTNTTSLSIEQGKGFGQPHFADGSLWVINQENGTVRRFDAASTKMLDEFAVAKPHEHGLLTHFLYYFAVANGDLWVNDASGENSFLVRIDATTHQRAEGLPVYTTQHVGLVHFLQRQFRYRFAEASCEASQRRQELEGSFWLRPEAIKKVEPSSTWD